MYVCICNAITEKSLKQAASDVSVRSAKQAYRHLGCEVDCGQCLKVAGDVLAQIKNQDFAQDLALAAQ